MENKKNNKFTVREIVFLSIITLASLIFSAIMPLALYVNFYGATHLIVAFQIAFFFQIGLYKVNKRFSFLILSTLLGIILLVHFYALGISFIVAGLVTEIITLPFSFLKEEKISNIVKTTLFLTITMLPYYYLYQALQPTKFANSKYFQGDLNNSLWFVFIIIFIITLVSFIASILARKVAFELNKAGVFNRILDGKKKENK